MQLVAGLTANYSARIVSSGLSLVVVPLFIKLLGIEAFALIGLHVGLIAWSNLLHFGLGHSMLRECARYTGGACTSQQVCNLGRSIEIAYIVILSLIGFIGHWLLLAQDSDWFMAHGLESVDIQVSLQLMLSALLLRLLAVLYRSALLGLQRQVQANIADIVVSILRYGLTLTVLWQYSADIKLYFLCQVLISASEVLVYRMLWARALPVSPQRARWDYVALQKIWRYSAGTTLISALTISLSQIDKLVLLSILSLEQFGYYSIAFVIASALGLLSTPVISVLQSRFAQLYAARDSTMLKTTYSYGCRILILAVVPAALILSIFSEQFLLVWQQNELTIAVAAPLMSLLVLAQMSAALANLNQVFQLAHGWTRLLIYSQSMTLLALLPLLYWGATRWGALGAATAMLTANACYAICLNYLGHKRLMPELRLRWFSHYLAPTLTALALSALLIKYIYAQAPLNLSYSLTQLGIASLSCLVLGFVISGELRSMALSILHELINRGSKK